MDGTKLVTVHSPIELDDGELELALYGSFLPVPQPEVFGDVVPSTETPGEILAAAGTIELNAGKDKALLQVTNTCDRPIQVGSHYHLIEANRYLLFDRRRAFQKRLNIPSGSAVRFEPGETKTVCVVDIDGARAVLGGNGLCRGSRPVEEVMRAVVELGFGHREQPATLDMAGLQDKLTARIPRLHYAEMFGPSTDDRVRLGETGLVVRIERNLCAPDGIYGNELKFGGGQSNKKRKEKKKKEKDKEERER